MRQPTVNNISTTGFTNWSDYVSSQTTLDYYWFLERAHKEILGIDTASFGNRKVNGETLG
jgi:hypothetical protein